MELRVVMGTDDTLNFSRIPKKLVAKLNATYKTTNLHTGLSNGFERWFVVWDEYATEKLSKLIPLATEGMPCYWINESAYLVWFDWSIQKFIVSV
jgi:hypothetical protein